MKMKLIGIIVGMLLLITSISTIEAFNMHTSVESRITNLTDEVIWVGVEYTIYITFEDPDGDLLYLWVDWGDGNMSGWLGPYNSGETVSFTHWWTKTGIYEIKMKVKDVYGNESEWSSIIIKVISPPRFFRHMKISGMLKTRPWRGLIFSLISFDCATVTEGITGNEQLEPFTCHNYKFVALALNVHS
ncbi:MAG: PKD domain-containing protein, partial [Thermoplasmatales archaeon]